MKTILEISLRYARRGMDAIQDSLHWLKEVNDSIEITSTNTVEYEVDSDDENDITDALENILIGAGIPEDEYWFKNQI